MSRSRAVNDLFIAVCWAVAIFLATDSLLSIPGKRGLELRLSRHFFGQLSPRVIIK